LNTEIFALIEKHLTKVKQSGPENIMAVCPFHRRPDGSEEQTPSFTMSVTRGLYHCFSCHESGGLAKFLREMGVSRSRIDRDYKHLLEELEKYRSPPANPFRITPIAAPLPLGLLGLFDYCPVDLLEDGFDEGLLAKLDIGFDKLHKRITYPLRDKQGQLVGISGRTTTLDNWPRYKLYDEEYRAWGLPARKTNKRSLVWNLHNVYPTVYFNHREVLVIVEGFKACMRLLQAGIRNTVALLGSYMSREQLWLIESLGAATILVMFDNDDAGWGGRIDVGRALARGHADVRIVEYETHQPSDLTTEEVHEAIETAVDYRLWKIQGRHQFTDNQLPPEE
jgi:DNA primase